MPALLQTCRRDVRLGDPATVAKHFKKPQSFVSTVETGERRIDPTELQEFAKLYGQPIMFFLDG